MDGSSRHEDRPRFGDLFDWLEQGLPVPEWWAQFAGTHVPRVEEWSADDEYVVRVELPGVDPGDIDVTVEDGVLSVAGERREAPHAPGRSEFRYGTFARRVRLPGSARAEGVTATCADGVLEVHVPTGRVEASRGVKVRVARPGSAAGPGERAGSEASPGATPVEGESS